MEKTCSSGVEVDQLLTLQPICIVEDMVTSGVSISKSRIGKFVTVEGPTVEACMWNLID